MSPNMVMVDVVSKGIKFVYMEVVVVVEADIRGSMDVVEALDTKEGYMVAVDGETPPHRINAIDISYRYYTHNEFGKMLNEGRSKVTCLCTA